MIQTVDFQEHLFQLQYFDDLLNHLKEHHIQQQRYYMQQLMHPLQVLQLVYYKFLLILMYLHNLQLRYYKYLLLWRYFVQLEHFYQLQRSIDQHLLPKVQRIRLRHLNFLL